jgi:hypothetical protein
LGVGRRCAERQDQRHQHGSPADKPARCRALPLWCGAGLVCDIPFVRQTWPLDSLDLDREGAMRSHVMMIAAFVVPCNGAVSVNTAAVQEAARSPGLPTGDRQALGVPMSGVMFHLTTLAVLAVLVVLLLGLWNMMRGSNPSTSQKLMRWRVGLQFLAIVVIMAFVLLTR